MKKTFLIIVLLVLIITSACKPKAVPGAEIETVNIPQQLHTCQLSSTWPPEIKQWQKMIEDACQEYNIEPDVIATIIQIGSNGKRNAIGPGGEVGLMQIVACDSEISQYTNWGNGRPTTEELLIPETNIAVGTEILWQKNKTNSILETFFKYGGSEKYLTRAINTYCHFSQNPPQEVCK
jgi:soluble lytic murein transglycosylase-like protein